ncbi:MAG: hypothetical protein ACLTK0_01305 [Anaerovoracaceae bacterium]
MQREIWAKVPYRLTFNQERYVSGHEETVTRETVWRRRVRAAAERRSRRRRSRIIKAKKSGKIRDKVNQQIRQWAKENLPENSQILNKDLNFSYKENIIEVGVTLEVRQQIGEEQEILIGEESTDTSGD